MPTPAVEPAAPAPPSPRPQDIYGPLFRAGVSRATAALQGCAGRFSARACWPSCGPTGRPGTLLIVNDRLDVALAGGADGVHLGQDDLPLLAARRIAPPGFLIGVSTHNQAQAATAMRDGADYIGFGPIFATASKRNPDPCVGLAGLTAVCARARVPVVAIGGITPARVPELIAAGAQAVAIIAAVNQAPDIYAAALAVQRWFGLGSPAA